MAGHSKWANIKHRKGAQDAKRAKVFNKFSREIMVAASNGGMDPQTNPSLRLVIAKAKAQSMPKKNIEAAIFKGGGVKGGSNFKETIFAGNIFGVSFLITCLTNNINRIIAEIQHLFNKRGGNISGPSSVSYIFDRKGILEITNNGQINEDKLMMQSLNIGSLDFEATENSFFVYTAPQDFSKIKDTLNKYEDNFKTAEVRYIPNQEIVLPKEKAELILEFIDSLEENDDVQDVYHNLDADSLK